MILAAKCQKRAEQGFVLVAVIVFLTIFLVGASIFALWVERRIADAISTQEQSQLSMDNISTRNALLYLLSTGDMESQGMPIKVNTGGRSTSLETSFGLGLQSERNRIDPAALLKLDDRRYTGYGNCVFSIQDEAGLLLLNFISPQRLSQLLALLEVPFEERSALIDKLLDYQDSNDLVRLNGAERKAYEKAGERPPPNRQLLTTWEIAAVLDWKTKVPVNQLARLTTVDHTGAIAINSAPAFIIRTLPGIDANDAEKIILSRNNAPISSLKHLQLILGKNIGLLDMAVMFTPSLTQRITFWDPNRKQAEEFHITLTPFSEHNSPWIIDGPVIFSTVILPADQNSANQAQEILFFKSSVSAKKRD